MLTVHPTPGRHIDLLPGGGAGDRIRSAIRQRCAQLIRRPVRRGRIAAIPYQQEESIRLIGEARVIAERAGVVLRQARDEDLPRVDEITIICYTPIYESYVAMLGEECYEVVRHDPELTWEERKTGQVHRLYEEHPGWLWVLEEGGAVFGFVTFHLFPQQGYGHIDNNGVHPDYAGQGWGKFMYQQVLDYFRQQGVRFAHVDTGLDPAHIPARRAYEGVGFDRQVPTVEYWQDLAQNNPGSVPE